MKQNRNKILGLMEGKNVISVTPPGAKVLSKLSVPGLPTLVWMIVGQGPIVLAVGAGGPIALAVVRAPPALTLEEFYFLYYFFFFFFSFKN